MKKNIYITIFISIIITLLICVLVTSKPEKTIQSIDYDYICTYDATMEDDEGETSGKILKKMYLKVDNDSYVEVALYKSIYDSKVFNSSIEKITQDVLSLYDDIDGVETNITKNKKNAIVSIKYDYNKINFKTLKENLKEVLDEDSLQANMKSKIKVDDYINKSDYYKCQKK